MSLNQGTITDITIPGPGPFGFRLAGGKDFGLPLHISKITPGGKAQYASMREKDVILVINGEDVAFCTHLDAQNKIKAAFHDDLNLRTQRGDTRVWNPVSRDDTGAFKVSLKTDRQEFMHPGTTSNVAPKGYGAPPPPAPAALPPPGGRGSAQVVHLQFNSPAGLYSANNIAETFKGQTEGLIDGAVGNEEFDQQPRAYEPMRDTGYGPKPVPQQASAVSTRPAGTRSVRASGGVSRPSPAPAGQQVRDLPNCAVCESNIISPSSHTPTYTQPPPQRSPQAYRSPQANYAPPPPPPPPAPAPASKQVPSQVAASNRPRPVPNVHAPSPQANKPQPTTARTTASGGGDQHCDGCRQIIKGPAVTALGKNWHPEHFVCAHCHDSLQNQGFVEHDHKLYCQADYNKLYAPKCFQCGQCVAGNCVTAMGHNYHPEHFLCFECNKPIGDQQFMVNNGQPYCRKDHEALFSHRCASCNFTIDAGDPWVEAMDKTFHSNCFNCSICQTPLEGQKFYAKAGRPVCQTHAY